MDFYHQYLRLSREELFKVLLSTEDYQSPQVEAANRVLEEKQWVADFHLYMAEQAAMQIDTEDEVEEKAAYYRKAVEFKEGNNYIRIRAVDATRLAGALIQNNIDYYCEEKNPEFYFAPYPAMHFYFKEEDLLKADRLVKELGLSAGIYDDYAQLWKPHTKIYIAAVLLSLIGLILYSVFSK